MIFQPYDYFLTVFKINHPVSKIKEQVRQSENITSTHQNVSEMASQDIPVDFEDSLLNTHHMQQYQQGKNVSQTATGKCTTKGCSSQRVF